MALMGGAGGALGGDCGAILELEVGGEKQELGWQQELAEAGEGLVSLTFATSKHVLKCLFQCTVVSNLQIPNHSILIGRNTIIPILQGGKPSPEGWNNR